MTIEPTRVIPPGGDGGPQQGRTYVIYDRGAPNGGPGPGPGPGPGQRFWNRIPDQNQRVTLPSQVPGPLRSTALNNRAIVFNAWIVAMIVIGFDEWHNLNILPRPARLWDASLVYGVLVLLGFVDIMVPLANALAIGYTIMLIWQYYQGGITPQGLATGTTQAPGTTTAGGRG